MEHLAFIDINLLNQEAKKELEAFYEFLLFKHKKQDSKESENNESRFEKFLTNPLKIEHFEISSREERNER